MKEGISLKGSAGIKTYHRQVAGKSGIPVTVGRNMPEVAALLFYPKMSHCRSRLSVIHPINW